MLKKIRSILIGALKQAREKGQLTFDEEPPVILESPKEKIRADLSTNLAMMMAKSLKVPPAIVAQTIVENLPKTGEVIKEAEIAGPGFVNLIFSDRFFHQILADLAESKAPKKKTGEKILLEFVSANPTGPLNVVNARAAALGDALARLLEKTGCRADREFYVNDEGSQIENLARSVEARYLEMQGKTIGPFHEDWYSGEYVKDLAKSITAGFGDAGYFLSLGRKVYGSSVFSDERLELLKNGFHADLFSKLPDEKERLRFLGCAAVIAMAHAQRIVLKKFRLVFQRWYFQSQLGDKPAKAMDRLKSRGYLYEKDGAIWFKSTEFKDDKDRVLVRQDGRPTYFQADIAYHNDKKERGYDRLIDFLGPDHHGYIARTLAAIEALGYPRGCLEIYLIQLVTLVSGGKALRMSKRAGEFVTMEELINDVGVDAARWYFLNRHRDSHLEFDIELAKLQSDENPLYYVQYAHARIAGILRMAEESGVASSKQPDLSPLVHDAEKELIKKMAQKDALIALAAEKREPHHLTRYAYELARTFHGFYSECRVLDNPDVALTKARLFLVAICKNVLAEILGLMGISAPEKM